MSPTFDNPGDGSPPLGPSYPARRPGSGTHDPDHPSANPPDAVAEPHAADPHAAPAAADPEHRDAPIVPRTEPMAPRRDQQWDEDTAELERGRMSFFEHLEELRWVLMHSLIATAVGAIAGWLLAPMVLEDAIRRTVKHAVVLSPLEGINERFKLAMIIGLFIALPIVLYKLWGFVLPGLFKRERKWVVPMAAASLVLFAAGAAASYFYVVPLVINVLTGFLTPSMVQQIQLGSLLGFVYNMSLACGLVCQLPLVTMTLTAIGLVTPGFLLKQWRYAIVGSFLVTAIITPGDVWTAQIVMGAPMTLLYFISVGLSFFVARKKSEAAAATGEVQHVAQG